MTQLTHHQPASVVLAGASDMLTALVQAHVALPTTLAQAFVLQGIVSWEPPPYTSLLASWVRRHNLPLLKGVRSLNDEAFLALLQGLPKPCYVVVASWGQRVVSRSLHTHPQVHWLNVHPSLLPAYRGPNPYIAAIKAGETTTGLTLHLMSEGYDQGPLLTQVPVPILPTDTGGSLRQRSTHAVGELWHNGLNALAIAPDPWAWATPQNEAQASYVSQKQLDKVELDWQADPVTLERQVRAYQPWTHCLTFWQGRTPLGVRRLQLAPTPEGSPVLGAGQVVAVLPKGQGPVVATACPHTVAVLSRVSLYLTPCEVFAWPWLTAGWLACRVKQGDTLTTTWQSGKTGLHW
jgi:methionyl-tRNA formyltransferase